MAKVVGFILILLILAVPLGVLEFLSTHSVLSFDPVPKAIGEATTVDVRIANPHGARRVAAFVEQNGSRIALTETKQPANRFTFWRAHLAPEKFQFIAGRSKAPALKEGKARLVVEAESNDLRGSTDSTAADVEVIFRPPSVTTD
ncbi:MAG TPA: hypothetical protein VNY75_05680, partial [Rhizomicrobium sp.]|nr:hypothetical protein [Rhizomicrobium sp.]